MSVPSPEETDRLDMARLVAGHPHALDSLMERHGEKLFGYLLRSLADEQDAADLSQETFVRVYHSRAQFDPRQKFTTWLYAIASNLVRDRYRWRKRHPQISLEDQEGKPGDLHQTLAEERPLPEELLASRERAVAVQAAIGALPEELRLPLILFEYEDLSHAEIGSNLGYSTKAVENRLYRARQRLRQSLGRFFEENR